MVEIINERPSQCRRKWYRIFVEYINGETKEVARFTHQGDVALYLRQFEKVQTVVKVIIR